MSVEVIEQPTFEGSDAEPIEAPVLPIMAHANRYSDKGKEEARVAEANETPEQKTARQEAVAKQKRDKANGQFTEGRQRTRREADKASPEDVPRIHQLTARAKGAEERVLALEAEVARLKAVGAPVAQVERAEARVEAVASRSTNATTFAEPEPTEDDPKFVGDYGKYLRAVSGWEGRKAWHESKESDRVAAENDRNAQAQRAAAQSFLGRIEAAKARYPDFDEVAYAKPALWLTPNGDPIPVAVTLDAWIKEHDAGPDVLHYFQQDKNRGELESLLSKPMIKQVDHLALLSQRLLPEASNGTGVTRAVPTAKSSYVPPPKPPTLVRTEALRPSVGPPPTDGSMSVLDHAKAFKRS